MQKLDADMQQRRANLAQRQAEMKDQMMRDGTHLFSGRRYFDSSHGSVVLSAIINQALWDATQPQWQRAQDAIFIRPKYMSDAGLLAHEQTHVKQWLRTLGLHSFLYLFSKSYRLKSEVEAYKVQLGYYANDNSDLFAGFIANNYGLGITKEQAKELLK